MFLFLTSTCRRTWLLPDQDRPAFLPLTGVLVVTSTTVQTKVIARTGAKPLVAVGMALGVIAMLLLTRLAPAPATQATSCRRWSSPARHGLHLRAGVQHRDAAHRRLRGGRRLGDGQPSQQVGGSVGTALLSTIFASATAAYAASHVGTPGLVNAASIHGYTTAFAWAAESSPSGSCSRC